jgi:transcriptional regulator with XRE-family HTH domain
VLQSKDKNHPAVLAMKDYIARKKISRDALAAEAGVGLVTINRLMSGDIPREDTLRKIESRLNISLTAKYELLADSELGAYPKSWCEDLLGEYVAIRQNRWIGGSDIINTFPVVFAWCGVRPGLKMSWEFQIDLKNVKRQSAYISMTSRDGSLTIIGSNSGHFTSTHLQRDQGCSDRLFGIYCGFGQVRRAHRAIVVQVVAYVRRSEIDFKHDNQVRPGAPGHQKLSGILSEIEGVFCHIIKPPEPQP